MLSLSCAVRQTLEFVQSLKISLGETWGDIPVYSLHRIKNLLKKIGINLSADLEKQLVAKIFEANRKYREETGNNYNCLTSNNLTWAIEQVEAELTQVITDMYNEAAQQNVQAAEQLKAVLNNKKDEAVRVIQNWFSTNYERLIYDMGGHIPWPILKGLQQSLMLWKIGHENPFNQNIEDMIVETAASQGINTDNAEDAWKAMGGKLFTSKE